MPRKPANKKTGDITDHPNYASIRRICGQWPLATGALISSNSTGHRWLALGVKRKANSRRTGLATQAR